MRDKLPGFRYRQGVGRPLAELQEKIGTRRLLPGAAGPRRLAPGVPWRSGRRAGLGLDLVVTVVVGVRAGPAGDILVVGAEAGPAVEIVFLDLFRLVVVLVVPSRVVVQGALDGEARLVEGAADGLLLLGPRRVPLVVTRRAAERRRMVLGFAVSAAGVAASASAWRSANTTLTSSRSGDGDGAADAVVDLVLGQRQLEDHRRLTMARRAWA
jgi:hypothetical protein